MEKISTITYSLPFVQVEVDLSHMQITQVSQLAHKAIAARGRPLILLTRRYLPVQSIRTFFLRSINQYALDLVPYIAGNFR